MPPRHPIPGSATAVSGGSGFIGTHLVRALVSAGASRIVVIDRQPPPEDAWPDTVQLHSVDLGDATPAELGEMLTGVDYLFHLAASKHSADRRDPREMLRSNVLGTQSLLQGAATAGVRRVVFTSSLYAYGRRSAPPLDEAELPRPDTVYGISKLAGEQLVEQQAGAAGFTALSLRLFFVYGPGQHRGSGYKTVIVKNFERILRGEQPTVCGDGAQVLDYVFIGDVIGALLRGMESDISGETLNVGSGHPMPIETLVDTMVSVAGSHLAKSYVAADDTAGTFRVARTEAIAERLGWQPRTPLEVGLAETLEWIRSRSQP
jgi:UDP-glucose 4-epimerase